MLFLALRALSSSSSLPSMREKSTVPDIISALLPGTAA
jgi:hypothetical protein